MSYDVDYKVVSLLIGGPRYCDRARELLGGVSDESLRSLAVRVIETCVSGNSNAVRTQYTSCFVNDYRGVPCPPYESWYKEGRLYGRVVHELSTWYRKRGVYPAALPEDHASAILEFASFLYASGSPEDADRFVSEHVISWMRRLASDVLAKCDGEYAAALGRLLSGFIDREASRLSGQSMSS